MKILKYITLLVLGIVVFSCTEDDAITTDNHFFNYEIPIEPVNSDYTVGGHYSKFVRSSAVPETPTIGIYDSNLGNAQAYSQHVTQAQTGGIDFFIFGLRSSVNMTQHNEDKNFINTLQTASNAGTMKFALSYNFGSMALNNNNRIEGKGLVPTFLNDFTLMLPYFQKSNYMKINGKSVVYMSGSHNLFSDDNAALYQQLRTQMSGLGVELYIIGEQDPWTPPLRYDFRFVNGVDALTHQTYANINIGFYDRYISFHKMIDLAWGYHKETLSASPYNIEYVPTISPSINPKIANAGSANIVIDKDPDWFKATCNVARRVVGANKLVLIDSFNNWNSGTQLESANTYGDQYLQILKSQFKVN